MDIYRNISLICNIKLHRLQIFIEPVHHPGNPLFPSVICLCIQICPHVGFLYRWGHSLKISAGKLIFFEQGRHLSNLFFSHYYRISLIIRSFILYQSALQSPRLYPKAHGTPALLHNCFPLRNSATGCKVQFPHAYPS